jgi:hypothetical protein
MNNQIIQTEWVQQHIYFVRGCKVMLSNDLAQLYQVEPRVLVQAVKRNKERFPADFMFQLENHEFSNLKSQIVISSWGGQRVAPYAFTEQGIAMLSGILNSARAIQVNIEIMRTFVSLRRFLLSHRELANNLTRLEEKYDHQFKLVFDAIRELIMPPEPKRRKMGFHADEED